MKNGLFDPASGQHIGLVDGQDVLRPDGTMVATLKGLTVYGMDGRPMGHMENGGEHGGTSGNRTPPAALVSLLTAK